MDSALRDRVTDMQTAYTQAQEKQQDKEERLHSIGILVGAMARATESLVSYIEKKHFEVSVDNLPTSINTPDVESVVKELKALQAQIKASDSSESQECTKTHLLLENLREAIEKLPHEYPEAKEPVEAVTVKNMPDYTAAIAKVVEAVKAIEVDVRPQVTVKPTDVVVQNDFSTLETQFNALLTAVKAIELVVPETDDSAVIEAVDNVASEIKNLKFPVPNFTASYKDANGVSRSALVDSSGNVMVNLATQIAGEDSTNNALRIEGIAIDLTGSAGAAGVDLISSYDVSGMSRFSLQIVGTWVGTITISCSNDNQNFGNAVSFNAASTTVGGATSITANGTYYGWINFKYIRVRMTAWTSGTATAYMQLLTAPGNNNTFNAQAIQSGTWTMQPAIAGSSAVTSTAANTTSVSILASNTSRRAAYVVNASDKNMYVKFGTTASATSYTKKLAPGEDWALPTPPIYSGVIHAIWETGPTGSAIVTELT